MWMDELGGGRIMRRGEPCGGGSINTRRGIIYVGKGNTEAKRKEITESSTLHTN